MSDITIGRSATDQDSRGGNGEVWIKGFKAGQTRFRIVQPVTTVKNPDGSVKVQGWHFYYEHYKGGVGYFGCTEDHNCRGCSDPDPKVQDRNKRYGFNAIDESGRLSVFKVGPSVYKVMKSREQRLDTVMDRDYTIVKSGSGLDTMYEVEAGDRYPVDIPDELHNIGGLLVAKILSEVIPAYDGVTPSTDEGNEDGPVLDHGQADVAKVTKAVDDNIAKEEQQAGSTGHPDFEDMATSKIAAWLEDHGVEVTDRTPRTKLIKMALSTPPF